VDKKLLIGILVIIAGLAGGCLPKKDTDCLVKVVVTDASHNQAGVHDRSSNRQIEAAAYLTSGQTLAIHTTGAVDINITPIFFSLALTPQSQQTFSPFIMAVSPNFPSRATYVGNGGQFWALCSIKATESASNTVGNTVPVKDQIASAQGTKVPPSTSQPAASTQPAPQSTGVAPKSEENHQNDNTSASALNRLVNGIKKEAPLAIIVAVITALGVVAQYLGLLLPRQPKSQTGRCFQVIAD
jgi:hypothetical protein